MNSTGEVDLRFYFDPVCPFAWMTSKWVRMVAAERDYNVDWRFISLRLINSSLDYHAQFPPGYEDGHNAGLRMLRVAARLRAEYGRAAVGPFYLAVGTRIFDTAIDGAAAIGSDGGRAFLEPILREAELDPRLIDTLDDGSIDAELSAETQEALSLTGEDVGTPILHFRPPNGTAFFGPVISRLPTPAQAGQLWDNVIGLAGFAGFSELKRSLRERPQLASFGVDPDTVGIEEDWHGGSRRRSK